MLGSITPVILTLNEEGNIGRSLEGVCWAKDIVLVDSGSSDGTFEVASSYRQVRIFNHAFQSHAEQWNFAISETQIKTDWVLALDADYIVSPELTREFGELEPRDTVAGYRARFVYVALGRPLRGSLYPPVVVLFRRDRAEYRQGGHTQRLQIHGEVIELEQALLHDDRKNLSRWWGAQQRYMQLEAQEILSRPWHDLKGPARVRRFILPAPFLVLAYCLFVKGLVLDGWPGLLYSLQRTAAEGMLSFHLATQLFKGQNRSPTGASRG